MIRRALAALFLRVTRYRVVAEPFPDPPAVVVGGPHTSYWDFAFFLAALWTLRLRVRFLGADRFFRGPLGPVMRALGGIPVDRANRNGLVAELVGRIRAGERFYLVIAPEGTRRPVPWKSGFHRIARETGIPVVLGFLDSVTRTVGLGPTIEVTDDLHADMAVIRAFYRDKKGLHPEWSVEPYLAGEDPR
ncbi:1-acyl-sn-glycerol-3-phosphate acyltransferase [Antribacter gilvus]|uniref:1-acyl-sn-glycerol-3-phosphate acyltransferase n=1 Tax=Antribacter gilvus TaxID=2304675 RepID=UPI000F7A59B5|nr:1-acyl-sn-glycerol-3-phosphate acyltransferase [Antribacter gilvus]